MSYVLLVILLLAPFAVTAALAGWAHRDGHLRWHLDQFRFSAPMVGRLFDDEPVRSEFERHPSWPVSGVLGERR